MGHLFASMKADTPAIELSREFLGLLIVAAWMATVAVFSLVTRH
jgi:transmembrane protein TMEM220